MRSRRELRAAEARGKNPAPRASSQARTRPATRPAASTAVSTARKVPPTTSKKRIRGGIFNLTVMTLAGGLIATMALPAYAFTPGTKDEGKFSTSAIDSMRKTASQSVTVDSTAVNPVVKRDKITATSEEELQAQREAEQAQEAREEAAAQMEAYAASYSGPTAADYLKNPSYPSFSLSKVFSVAQQYIGTPYVYGGASPAGFDCSGYVMFVYAQFGISLPHSVSGQAARGKRISIEDAVPGDIVIMNGHDGFYAGNGNIMDAPDTGRSISVRPIWTDDFYIVRLGI